MRLLGLIFLIFILFPTLSNASTYIKVTKTTSAKQLNKIKSAVQRMGIHVTHKTTRTGYVVYAGPFKSYKSAKYSLRKVKRQFRYAKIIKIKKTRSAIITDTSKGNKYDNILDKYFVNGSIGYSNTPLTHTGKFEIYLPKENGISYDLSVGRDLKYKDIFVTAGYLRADSDDVIFDNIYASVNYKFGPYGIYTPYFGLLAGYSLSTWNINPLDNSKNSASNSSESFFGGTQVGAIYDGYDEVSLYANYQCLFMNHSTTLTTASETSELKHKSLHNLQIGVRYRF